MPCFSHGFPRCCCSSGLAELSLEPLPSLYACFASAKLILSAGNQIVQHPGPDPLTQVPALPGAPSMATLLLLEQPGRFGVRMMCLGKDVPLVPFSPFFPWA